MKRQERYQLNVGSDSSSKKEAEHYETKWPDVQFSRLTFSIERDHAGKFACYVWARHLTKCLSSFGVVT